jgi:tRNA-Thr(GGU) m(6)t(6)A37 methyltransferase TsaA
LASWGTIIFTTRLAIFFFQLAQSSLVDDIPNQGSMTIECSMTIEYKAIGKFHSDLTPGRGAPRQGASHPENKATIEIYEEYTRALWSLEKYEYIIVLYHMHLSRDWHPEVRPPGSKKVMGLFATRSPRRPNPIGFGVIKLEGIDGNKLHVSGMDAFDGTPVLDIKPWIPDIDCPAGNADPDIEGDLGL